MKKVFLGFLILFLSQINAQNKPKEVLFTIDEKPFYVDEFERVYNKNLDLVKDESQKDLNHYLELFVGYKLKVTKANKIGLQNDVKYQNELKSYRTQLSKNYTSDSKVTAELVKEGHERLKKEIRASHILIMVDENASPEDTLKAYKKIADLRQRIISGESFDRLAQDYSEDPSAKENKGDLGYFTSFRMVYAFENAAYKTPKGQISNPIRTRFGYHIIKVNDIRDNRGEVAVSHIMLMNQKEGEDPEKPKQTIQEIYKKIQQGESFEDLAKQFSEDKSSASKGGVLNRFGSGQLSSQEFEDVAFSLTKDNPISQPFQSQFGWHIVKFIDKFPIKSFEDSKTELENKIARDDRSRLITNSLTEKLRKKYKVKRDEKMFTALSKVVTNDYYDAKWEMPDDVKPFAGKLFSIESRTISGEQFLNYIKSQQKSGTKLKPISKALDILYDKFKDDQLNQYYNDNLEVEFPEFASVVEEYRDGLLLFDLMEREIWQRAKTDTIGLKKFYADQNNKPRWKTRLDLAILSSTKQEVMKKVLSMLKKGTDYKTIKEKLNTNDVVNVMVTEGVNEVGSSVMPKGTKQEVGLSEIFKEGDYYYITKVNKVIPEGDKTLDECRGKMVNDYQQYLEQNWVNELKKEFSVKVNQDVFEKIKTRIKK
ncbi:peptidylprolyl isomerase [Flavobacterium sp.]|uniref:peptidylprolyl isomerase n=1 Tax=Flavobacterium sp. TaxID=239 RepID=UPI002609B14F|nr:peptidylprolyl isomerase [Flavobacterium sp.]